MGKRRKEGNDMGGKYGMMRRRRGGRKGGSRGG
jgi:hypothetical protein